MCVDTEYLNLINSISTVVLKIVSNVDFFQGIVSKLQSEASWHSSSKAPRYFLHIYWKNWVKMTYDTSASLTALCFVQSLWNQHEPEGFHCAGGAGLFCGAPKPGADSREE